MTDLRLARKWINLTGADEVIEDRDRLKRVSLSLLRAWRRYKKTGRCPWTGEELYDYTHFLHAFADRYAGPDDKLYDWLSTAGLKMLDTIQYPDAVAANRFCPVCGQLLTPSNVVAGDGQGKAWCITCTNSARLRKIIGS